MRTSKKEVQPTAKRRKAFGKGGYLHQCMKCNLKKCEAGKKQVKVKVPYGGNRGKSALEKYLRR